jgi:hypothetical protein
MAEAGREKRGKKRVVKAEAGPASLSAGRRGSPKMVPGRRKPENRGGGHFF